MDYIKESEVHIVCKILPFVGSVKASSLPFVWNFRPFVAYRGFSIIELVVTVSILGLLVAMGGPSLNNMIHSNRLATSTNDLLADLNLARVEAIKRKVTDSTPPVPIHGGVCKSDNGTSCTATGNWASGWIVFLDNDNDQAWSAGDTVLRKHEPLATGNTLSTAASDIVIFSNQGLATIGGGKYIVCNTKIGKFRTIDLGATGRAALSGTGSC